MLGTPQKLGYTMEGEPRGFAIATLVDAALWCADRAARRATLYGSNDLRVLAYREANILITEICLTKVV